jgi:hypothetical protein
MKGLLFFVLGCLVFLNSCDSKNSTYTPPKSVHPFANYFYPYDSVPRIYCYRNVANGLDEEFHRVFGIKDSKGHHVIVEKYSPDGRLIEAFNYNYDSLDVLQHIVVDRKKHKNSVPLKKNKRFPWNEKDQTLFISEYPSHFDSIIVIDTLKRKIAKKNIDHLVLEEEARKSMILDEFISKTLLNIYTKKTITNLRTEGQSIYCEGFGLVEFYSKNKTVHFKLEKVISQKEWAQFITRR